MRHEYGTPVWDPLERVIEASLRANFMYMGQAVCEGVVIYQYKHSRSRRYLNIDAEGRTYRYQPGETRQDDQYYQIPRDQAHAAVFA